MYLPRLCDLRGDFTSLGLSLQLSSEITAASTAWVLGRMKWSNHEKCLLSRLAHRKSSHADSNPQRRENGAQKQGEAAARRTPPLPWKPAWGRMTVLAKQVQAGLCETVSLTVTRRPAVPGGMEREPWALDHCLRPSMSEIPHSDSVADRSSWGDRFPTLEWGKKEYNYLCNTFLITKDFFENTVGTFC